MRRQWLASCTRDEFRLTAYRQRLSSRCALALALALLLLGTPAEARDAKVSATSLPATSARSLLISGTAALSESEVRAAAGKPPARGDRDAWADRATRRVVALYKTKHYTYARARCRSLPGLPMHLHIDEGRMRVVFTGISSVTAFFYGRDLFLPHGVFHEPSLRASLQRLKRKHGLLNIYYRIKTSATQRIDAWGAGEPQRVLQIFVVTRDFVGWGFELGLNSSWGVLPGVAYSRRLFWPNDRLRLALEVGFPYRRYLFDANPKLQWVHGSFALEYTLPRMAAGYLAPRLDASLTVSRFDRPAIGLASYHLLRSPTLASLVVFLPATELSLGAGLEVTRVFQLQTLPETPLPELVPGPELSLRGLLRLAGKIEARSAVLRRDWRSFAALRLDVIASEQPSWLLRVGVAARLFWGKGRHRLLLSGQGVLLAGEVRFWDDTSLAGSYQRVFFGNVYWVRQAAQLELAYRINLWWDWLDLGVFHDLSVFGDRTQLPATTVGIVNAFGPSLHFLLYDILALDFYFGFGFAQTGFDHTISFSAQTVF